MGAPLKIAVAVPAHDLVPAHFAYDYAGLVGFTSAAMGPDDQLYRLMQTATYIHDARQDLALIAVQSGCSHVLWIDADMRFPANALMRLLKRNVPVVGINYSTRGVPPKFVAIKDMGLDGGASERLATAPDSTGLEEVQGIGFGLLLMETKVIRSVADELPIFGHEWLPDRKQWVGEDAFFCRKIRAKGARIFVDHDLSKECAHIGQMEYRLEHAQDALGEA